MIILLRRSNTVTHGTPVLLSIEVLYPSLAKYLQRRRLRVTKSDLRSHPGLLLAKRFSEPSGFTINEWANFFCITSIPLVIIILLF